MEKRDVNIISWGSNNIEIDNQEFSKKVFSFECHFFLTGNCLPLAYLLAYKLCSSVFFFQI